MEKDQVRPRARRTKAERRELLVELRATGKSVRAFALERGLPICSSSDNLLYVTYPPLAAKYVPDDSTVPHETIRQRYQRFPRTTFVYDVHY